MTEPSESCRGWCQTSTDLREALAAEREKSARLEKEKQDARKAVEATLQAAESELAAVTKERDNALDLAQIKTQETTALLQDRDRLQKERDAYKKAKEENDERFMIDRDQALAKLKERERELEQTKDLLLSSIDQRNALFANFGAEQARAKKAEAGMAAMLECLDEALSMTRDHSERCSTGFANGCSCGNSEAKIRWSKALSSDAGNPILAELKALRTLLGSVAEYRQAIQDHSGDPCQCVPFQSPHECNGDCGPANARKVLAELQKAEAAGKNK